MFGCSVLEFSLFSGTVEWCVSATVRLVISVRDVMRGLPGVHSRPRGVATAQGKLRVRALSLPVCHARVFNNTQFKSSLQAFIL